MLRSDCYRTSTRISSKVVGSMDLKGLHVVDNGASVYDYTSRMYAWKEWLSVHTLQEVTRLLLPDVQQVIDCYPGFRMEPADTFSLDSIVEPAPYVYTRIRPNVWDALVLKLANIQGIYSSIVARDSEYWHLQVCSINGTKQHGVQYVQRLLGVDADQTLAIGDSQNDEPLFAAARVRVAMGNATDNLKAMATYVTDTAAEGGWAKAINKFVSQ